MKVRFIEPGNKPYKKSIKNFYIYDKYIRTPSQGAMTLATITKEYVEDVKMYSESISCILWEDVLDSDIVFITIFSFNANRGYELAEYIQRNSQAIVVIGGLHATLNHEEAAHHCDYVLRGEGDEIIIPFIKKLEEKKKMDMNGVSYYDGDKLIDGGKSIPPVEINTIPDRNLVHNFKKMTKYNTIWPQVHGSRGCPHNCDYCTIVAAFGRSVRLRKPENIIEDIRQAIAFFEEGNHRLTKTLWITDDNFFANKEWAKKVLRLIIEENIKYQFTIQARYEVGYDDEMLKLLRAAGFTELAMGIEFLEDEAFENYNKVSTYEEILGAVKNIQKHGLKARGLFIVGADNHTKGVGNRLANFVIKNDVSGVLIQSMYFIPGTPVYNTHKEYLIEDGEWSRCLGKVVHYPKQISAEDLQKEIILASRKIYSFPRLMGAMANKRGLERVLFIGEYFWQKEWRKELKRDIRYIRGKENRQ